MDRLKHLVVAEPASETAEEVARKLDRLAVQVHLVHRGRETIETVKAIGPELLLLSLELPDLEAPEILSGIRRSTVEPFVIATYRELSVHGLKELGRFGIGELAPHPLDVTSVYRAASHHFGRHFRRHTRHRVELRVTRVDGAAIGVTRDLSEGGMLVALEREVTVGMSQLWEVALTDGHAKPFRARCAVLGVDTSEGTQTAARVEFEKVVGPDLTRISSFLRSLEESR